MRTQQQGTTEKGNGRRAHGTAMSSTRGSTRVLLTCKRQVGLGGGKRALHSTRHTHKHRKIHTRAHTQGNKCENRGEDGLEMAMRCDAGAFKVGTWCFLWCTASVCVGGGAPGLSAVDVRTQAARHTAHSCTQHGTTKHRTHTRRQRSEARVFTRTFTGGQKRESGSCGCFGFSGDPCVPQLHTATLSPYEHCGGRRAQRREAQAGEQAGRRRNSSKCSRQNGAARICGYVGMLCGPLRAEQPFELSVHPRRAQTRKTYASKGP